MIPMPALSFLKNSAEKGTNTSSSTPSPSNESPSRYRPSRLLRRKTSTKSPLHGRSSTWDGEVDLTSYPSGVGSGPSTGSSTTSGLSEQQYQQQPYSQQSTNNFGDSIFGTFRRGSEITSSSHNGTLSEHGTPTRRGSDSVSKRTGGWYYDISKSQNPQDTVIILAETEPNPISIEGKETTQPSLSSSTPGRIAEDQTSLLNIRNIHNRPLTPPESVARSLYPTALSPPRRPLHKSPRPPRAPSSAVTTDKAISPGMLPGLSAVGVPAQPFPLNPAADERTTRPDSPIHPINGEIALRETTSPSPVGKAKSTVSAAWLASKPSSSRLGRKSSLSSRNPKIENGDPDDVAPIRRRSIDQSRIDGSSSSTGNETESQDSEIEHKVGLRLRKSVKRDTIRLWDRSSDKEAGMDGYEVEVVCNDQREGNEDIEEMRWEVVIRKKGLQGVKSPSSPQQLSTTLSKSVAPSTASSINLSLSLDQPTGKLVFISFPTDLQATPTRVSRRPSTSTSTSTSVSSSMLPSSPKSNYPGTPPLDGVGSPNTPSRRKYHQYSPTLASRRNTSPPTSPRDMFTPRRTRLVTPAQLDAGLYPKSSTEELASRYTNDTPADTESDDGLSRSVRRTLRL